jgi:hypothetical protein
MYPAGIVGRYLGMKTLLPSSVDCLEILEASTSCKPKGLFSPVIQLALIFEG